MNRWSNQETGGRDRSTTTQTCHGPVAPTALNSRGPDQAGMVRAPFAGVAWK